SEYSGATRLTFLPALMLTWCDVLAGDTTRPASTIANGYAPLAVTATCTAGAGVVVRGVVSFGDPDADGFAALDAGGRDARSFCDAARDDGSLGGVTAAAGLTAGSFGEIGSVDGGLASPRTGGFTGPESLALARGVRVADAESRASCGRSVARE